MAFSRRPILGQTPTTPTARATARTKDLRVRDRVSSQGVCETQQTCLL